ncbi:MAG: M14-type cytosolic carboxypeptidase [Clostridia bacterium]|nr:M14-type cytosolic carboxypeptidase [Clostridia bacterium]
MFIINDKFEGANIKVILVDENKVIIDSDLRDTTEDWFFWCFKIENAGGKTITFEFQKPHRIGYYGPAISYDNKNWHWQYSEPEHNGSSFTYSFKENENSVYFAHDMVYRPESFFDFAERQQLEIKTLCTSEKGRPIPYIDTGIGDECILLTARHHSCESTGSYVLEGILENIVNELSSEFRIICVPFVDYDGVTDGDQGKCRSPHDHNRDYTPDSASLYSSVAKIREITDNLSVRFAFDFHSPWHLGKENDTVFIPIKHYNILKNITRFSNMLENENNGLCLPHYACCDFQPDISWNAYGSECFGTYFGKKNAELSFSLETPYFKSSDVMFTPERARETGRCFVRALKNYIDRSYRIAVTGDILYENPMNISYKKENGYDYRSLLINCFPDLLDCDYLIGNTETPFAGERHKYTHERYCFNTPEEALLTLKLNGFDLFTLANNHCMDRGISGLTDTCNTFEKNGIDYIGISKDKRNSVFIKDIGDRKVAFVNATYGTNAFSHGNFLKEEEKLDRVSLTQPEETLDGYIYLLDELKQIENQVKGLYNPENEKATPYLNAIADDIAFAKENSDYVIMLLHSGGQYNEEPDAYTRLLCKKIKEMGADMIVANHPHIILPSSIDDDGFFTAYCLGNLQSMVPFENVNSTINKEYSVVLFIDFKKNEQKPHLCFSVMKSVFDKEFKNTPKVYNSYFLWEREKKTEIEQEILYFANRFMPGKNYTKVSKKYEIL